MADARTAQGFAPGHASGFFAVEADRGQDEAKGSTGAGICLSLGALSEATVRPGDGTVEAACVAAPGDGPDKLPVSETAARLLVGDRDVDVEIRTQLQLPVGQGLGMSGAGALSAALAIAPLLDQGRLEAARAAHLAELQHLTGLGDVAAQLHGGVVVRSAAGIPPYGATRTIPGDPALVLATVGDPIEEPSMLADRDRLETATALGEQALDRLLEAPSVDRFFQVSRAFAEQAGFVDDRLAEVLAEADAHGPATVALIGRTVVCAGDVDALTDLLRDHGEPRPVRVAARGAGRVRS